MTTLGFTGAADTTGISAGCISLTRVQATVNFTISTLSALLKLPNASYAHCFLCIYSDSAGAPGSPIDWSANFFDTPGPGVDTLITKAATQGASIVSGNYYHIGFWLQHDVSGRGSGTSDATSYVDIYNVAWSGTPTVPPAAVGTREEHRQFEATAAYVSSSSAATLTTATPSGTIGTSTSATPGFTTDSAGGTAVGVLDIPSKITGITAAQVKAGHNNLDAAPIKVLSSIVPTSGHNDFANQTGLTANTGYNTAQVQTISATDSNVLIGSFTTAVATTSFSLGLDSAPSTPLASTAIKVWTRNTIDGAVVDGGSGGLSATTDASGNVTISGLSIAAGSRICTYQVGSDTLNSHNVPVTVA